MIDAKKSVKHYYDQYNSRTAYKGLISNKKYRHA